MGLTNAMPAVCSAIGGNKFGDLAGVTLFDRTGPTNGANVYFSFSLGICPRTERQKGPRPERVRQPPRVRSMGKLDLDNALVLVSCVKSKLPSAAPACELYTSAWFRQVRDIVEASGARWFVLSALYGLVAPEERIEPYDYTLKTLGVAERRAWATKVLSKLLPEAAGRRRIVMFAGARYREFLIGPLQQQGIAVDVPMANLRLGEQLAWLSEHR